ncbi:MAG: ABC transporter substrate-binding protein, partial [Alphaproteobacteria bacterium]|nr:ABC transporter substrate-binding protein [Alphaproteobacteria bacterium]
MMLRNILAGLAVAMVAIWSLSAPPPASAADTVKVGYIGSFDTDTGKSTIRGTEIAIEELNAAGGVLGGRMIELVKADTREDVAEGIRAYEYLNEVENVDFIISGSIDDVSLSWLPRMAEYKIPTLDTWTSYVGIIDMVVNEYDKYKMYFMNVSCDFALAMLYVDFGKDVLAKDMGWKTVVVMQEDTAFAGGVYELIEQVLAPEANIKILEHIVYDINTVDFAPIYNKAAASKPDFIYLISSVRSQVPASQYVKLEVPVPMTGINVAALGKEFWTDSGGLGGGISTLSPIPSLGFELDERSADFYARYQAKYGDARPIFPHFNGFNAYYGMLNAFAAAERAGGFAPLDKWVEEMENEDIVIEKDGEMWLRYAFWKPGEIEPRTNREYTHNIKFDIQPPYDQGAPSMVV